MCVHDPKREFEKGFEKYKETVYQKNARLANVKVKKQNVNMTIEEWFVAYQVSHKRFYLMDDIPRGYGKEDAWSICAHNNDERYVTPGFEFRKGLYYLVSDVAWDYNDIYTITG